MGRPKSDNPVGKPTKYKEEYCEALINHMAQGFSYKSFAGVIRVHRSIMNDWEERYPEWEEAKDIGRSLSLLFAERLLLSGAQGEIENFSAASAIFNLKAQHAWTDRVEITGHVVHETWEQYLARIKNVQNEAIETTATALIGEDHQD
jgi:hypothetical protein